MVGKENAKHSHIFIYKEKLSLVQNWTLPILGLKPGWFTGEGRRGGGREGAYIWRENEEMFLWQVDLKEWQLSETVWGDSIVQRILGEGGYWAHNADRHWCAGNGKACE